MCQEKTPCLPGACIFVTSVPKTQGCMCTSLESIELMLFCELSIEARNADTTLTSTTSLYWIQQPHSLVIEDKGLRGPRQQLCYDLTLLFLCVQRQRPRQVEGFV